MVALNATRAGKSSDIMAKRRSGSFERMILVTATVSKSCNNYSNNVISCKD